MPAPLGVKLQEGFIYSYNLIDSELGFESWVVTQWLQLWAAWTLKMWLNCNKVMAVTKNICSNHKWALLNLHPVCLLWVLPLQLTSNYRSQLILTQHLRSLKKLGGRGHSSAQLWKITINSLLQIVHVFQGNTVLWGTFTPYSSWVKSSLKATQKSISLFHQDQKKTQPCSSCEKMLSHHPFQQLLDISELSEHSLHQQDQRDASLCPQLVAGQQCAADLHLLPAPFQTPPCQLSWTSFLDAFPLP